MAFNGSFKRYKLSNGFEVALLRTPTQTFCGGLTVDCGSLNERPGQEGWAHILEHCLVKGGTEKYSPEKANKLYMSFGSMNLGTGLTHTTMPVNSLADDVEAYLDLCSQMVFSPRLDPAKLEQERAAVLRERADMVFKTEYAEDRSVLAALCGEDSPHLYEKIGTEASIRRAGAEDLRVFHSQYFHPNNMHLILVGKLPENIDELVQNLFGERPAGKSCLIELPRVSPLTKRSEFRFKRKDGYNKDSPKDSSAEFRVITVPCHSSHEDSCSLSVLGHVTSNRLFNKIREQKGMAYAVNAGYGFDKKFDSFGVSGEVPSGRLDEAVEVFFEEMERLKKEKVTDEELKACVRSLKFSQSKTYESNEGLSSAIGSLMDGNMPPDEFFAKISRVTSDDVLATANRYLPGINGNYVLMIRDPLKKD